MRAQCGAGSKRKLAQIAGLQNIGSINQDSVLIDGMDIDLDNLGLGGRALAEADQRREQKLADDEQRNPTKLSILIDEVAEGLRE